MWMRACAGIAQLVERNLAMVVGGAPSLARDRDSSGLVSTKCAGIAQLVERNLAKVEVASSNLVSRSKVSPERLDGRVVMQRTATPFTPVRFRLEPPSKLLF